MKTKYATRILKNKHKIRKNKTKSRRLKELTCSSEITFISCNAFSMLSRVPTTVILSDWSCIPGILILVFVLVSNSFNRWPLLPNTQRWCSFGMLIETFAYGAHVKQIKAAIILFINSDNGIKIMGFIIKINKKYLS